MASDTEREALARLIDAHYDDYEPVYNEGGEAVSSTLADAILASDVWRNRQTHVEVLEPGEPSPCAGCGGDGVQIDDDPESTRQIVSTCGECHSSGSGDPS